MKNGVALGMALGMAFAGALAAEGAVAAGANEWRIEDGGMARRYEVALDELGETGADGRREVRKVEGVGTVAGLKERAVRTKAAAGREVELVLYEAGAERNEYTRRFLTGKVLVWAEEGADVGAAVAAAGGGGHEAAGHVPGHYLAEAAETGGALELAERLRGQPGILGAEPMLARLRKKKWAPNDTLYGQQWHLKNTGQGGGTAGIDVNVTNVWDSYRGTNVLIGIVDDGLQLTHTDLWQNVNTTLDWDFNGNDNNPSPDLNYDYHGTSCAGVAAGKGNNGRGISGAAPDATLVGYRLIGGETDDAMEAAAMATNNGVVHIKSNSWGPNDDGQTLEGPGALTKAAISNAAISGRGGKGTIITWAGGNGLDEGDNSNYDGYANSIYTIAVAAITDGGEQSWYSESGANLVVAAPSSGGSTDIITTDLMGNYGYNPEAGTDELADTNYTKTFGGTSSATPLVSGVLALVLQANSNLGWRDMQEILIRSAKKNAAGDAEWKTNAAGFAFNHRYGAGMIDARAAVDLALGWTNLGPQVWTSVAQTNVNQQIPDNNSNGIVRTFSVLSTNMRVEQVTATVDIRHAYRGNLAITLVSPSGMESRLSEVHADSGDHYEGWTFSSVRHWGEEAQGTWSLRIADRTASNVGTLRWARVEFFGTALAPASNQAPTLNSIGPKSVMASNLLTFSVSASDPVDGDEVRLWATNVPGWATFAGATNAGTAAATFAGTPPAAGNWTVHFFAADKDGTNTEAVAITATPYVSGMETFDNFTPSGSTYQTGSFAGQDGSTWTYSLARGDQAINGKSATLRNATNSYVRSGTIAGGVGTLTFKYRRPFSDASMGTKIYVAGEGATYTGTVTAVPATTEEVLTYTATNVNVEGPFVLLFTNTAATGRITIDDVGWTGYSSGTVVPPPEPITNWQAPTNGSGIKAWIRTAGGVTYALQYTTDLAGTPPGWIQVDSEPGTGGDIELSDPDSLDTRRFYRVVMP